jgi:hypothetical protein
MRIYGRGQLMAVDDDRELKSILKLRFPDGEVQIRWTDTELPEGVLVRSRGTIWRVKSSVGETVVLEPAPSDGGAQRAPLVKPDPLGEESVLLETLTL